MAKSAAPPATVIEVRMPASFPTSSRSRPINAPKTSATPNRMSI